MDRASRPKLKCDKCGLIVGPSDPPRHEWFLVDGGSFCSPKCAGVKSKVGGKASRDKGARRERQVVAWLESLGCDAQRVPLSGAAGGEFKHDVRATMPNGTLWHYEVKGRAQFKTLAGWLPADAAGEKLSSAALVLVPDRDEIMVVLSAAAWAALIRSTKP